MDVEDLLKEADSRGPSTITLVLAAVALSVFSVLLNFL
jgi:hypothetical protein